MTAYIYTQFQVNGAVNKFGKVYIGTYGEDPTDSDNTITVYTDEDLTNPVSGFGIDLDFNGLPLVDGSRVNLYSNNSYLSCKG